MERVPEEKRTGVERRVEEVVHEHRELEKKVRTKDEVSACAVTTTNCNLAYSKPFSAPEAAILLVCARDQFLALRSA